MACKRTPSWKSNSLRSKTLEQEAIFFCPPGMAEESLPRHILIQDLYKGKQVSLLV